MRFLSEHNKDVQTDIFTDGAPLAEKLKGGTRYDVIFLDIQLESSYGMDTAEAVRKYDKSVPIIFVTGLDDCAPEGYAVSAFDYIIKSDFDRKFEKVMTRLMQTLAESSISVEDTSGNIEIIPLGEIRTCLHKKCMWIFEHKFVADKAKIRRRAAARQGFLTQYAAKFAEKTCAYAYEDRF